MTSRLRDVLAGMLAAVGMAVGSVLSAIYGGFAPMAADARPSALEANLAMTAVHAESRREMGRRSDPLPVDEINLRAGLRLYRRNCLVCHGAADGMISNIAAGFSVPAPQFARDGVEDDAESTTYWKIRRGIRFTAMPAFRHQLSDTQLWQTAMFVKHMDRLPVAVDRSWRATPSAGERR